MCDCMRSCGIVSCEAHLLIDITTLNPALFSLSRKSLLVAIEVQKHRRQGVEADDWYVQVRIEV